MCAAGTYSGRVELSSNIKSILRPCVMICPDTLYIYKMLLLSQGFVEAQTLASKLNSLISIAERDDFGPPNLWGIQTIKCILQMASSLAASGPEENEIILLGTAVREFILPRIEPRFAVWIENIVVDIFGTEKVDTQASLQNDAWTPALHHAYEHLGMQPNDIQSVSAIQMHNLMDFRQSNIILGGSGTGKTTIWRLLADVHERIQGQLVTICVNPKTLSVQVFCGHLDVDGEWNDGLFTKVIRGIAKTLSTYHWVVFDSTISTDWIETVQPLFSNRMGCVLPNGERMSITSKTQLIFEASELLHATPCVLADCGLINIPGSNLWKHIGSR